MNPNEAYNQFCRLIHHTVHQFQHRYGGDREELVSIAHEHFMGAIRTHQADKSKLGTWIRTKVWYGLLQDQVNHNRHYHRFPIDGGDIKQVEDRQQFDCYELLKEVSSDARTIIRLVIDSPEDFRLAMSDNKREPHQAAHKVMWDRLKSIGWCSFRIVETIHEIQQALGA